MNFNMLIPLEAAGGGAAEIVKNALDSLQGNVTTILPVALGIAVLVFGAKYLWRTSKSVSQ